MGGGGGGGGRLPSRHAGDLVIRSVVAAASTDVPLPASITITITIFWSIGIVLVAISVPVSFLVSTSFPTAATAVTSDTLHAPPTAATTAITTNIVIVVHTL